MVEHTYWTPLAERPIAPSGLHHAPGNTVPVELLGVVMDGVTVDGLVVTGEVEEPGGVDDDAGGGAEETPESGRQAAILKPTHRDCNTLRIRPCSLRSIDSPHRALTEIQFPRYEQTYEERVGNQLLGSLSLFERLDEALAATSERGSVVSLAKAVRMAALHARAPESHASLSATTWSMST